MSNFLGPPPPYEVVEAQNEHHELGQRQGDRMRQDGQVVLGPLPPPVLTAGSAGTGGRSLRHGGNPISFHVYKAPGVFNKDDIVTHDDKQIVQGSQSGPLVCKISKEIFSSDFRVRMANGWSTYMLKSFISWNFEFGAFDGRSKYKWKRDGIFGADFTCFNQNNGDIIATWRSTIFSVVKDGQLLISKHYGREIELILATALVLEEWVRERKKRRNRRARR
ncbi:hypothetical protein T439DRAFT_361048 [Meredithblackwellia eburnea MCA 4105]